VFGGGGGGGGRSNNSMQADTARGRSRGGAALALKSPWDRAAARVRAAARARAAGR
jgi:hypothetical protein